MTPPAPQFPKNIGKIIGRARRLLELLVEQAPVDWDGKAATGVANGNFVTDVDLAERLNVSLGTAARWRRILEAVNLIGLMKYSKEQGYMIWIAAGVRAIAEELRYGKQNADAPTEGGTAREWVQ